MLPCNRLLTMLALAAPLAIVPAKPAAAWLDACNKTSEEIYVAVAYDSDQGWTSVGWWTIQPRSCLTMLGDALEYRYYYAYAETASGGVFDGDYNFCIQDTKFDIVGNDDCESRGYDSVGFYEHDIGGSVDYTVSFVP